MIRVCAYEQGLFLFCRSQEDLLALIDAHFRITSLCHDKTKALQYISGEAAFADKTVPLIQLL